MFFISICLYVIMLASYGWHTPEAIYSMMTKVEMAKDIHLQIRKLFVAI